MIQESRAIAKMTARCTLYMDALKKIGRSTPGYTHGAFPEIVNGLLLWSMLWKYVQNLKFVALPVP